MASWDIPPGWVAAKHMLEVTNEEAERYRLERDLADFLQSLATPTRRKAWLNRQLKRSGLVAIRCPRNNARQS